MAARIQIDTVRTDAAEMEYFRFGQGGETLAILPGLSVRSVMHWADAVAEAYRSLTDDFRKIGCPVLAIGSDDDRVLGPDAALQIARLNTRADFAFHLYHGYGHAVYDTAPDFKERIRRFLKDGPAE